MFPARAGMVRCPEPDTTTPVRVPRASGDGPAAQSDVSDYIACSPRERGWSLDTGGEGEAGAVFPARAGMVPRFTSRTSPASCVPRASGDGPTRPLMTTSWPSCSPRERGWSGGGHVTTLGWIRVPRASGDGPDPSGDGVLAGPCSPRERGWSPVATVADPAGVVFPARAGMVRRRPPSLRGVLGVPRASGDGPLTQPCWADHEPCSPRERGWSRPSHHHGARDGVFPARAGMVPWATASAFRSIGVPRASGDGPAGEVSAWRSRMCSPRERGWSRLGRRRPVE